MTTAKASLMMLSRGFQELLTESRYHDNWWCDVVLIDVMKTSLHYEMILDTNIIVAARQVNYAITKSHSLSSIDNHYSTNASGIYRMKFKVNWLCHSVLVLEVMKAA